MDTVTPEQIQTVAGASVIVTILMSAILAAWKPTPELRDRVGPILAIVVGVVVVVGYAAWTGADVQQALLTGLVVGSASMGIHDLVNGVTPDSVNI